MFFLIVESIRFSILAALVYFGAPAIAAIFGGWMFWTWLNHSTGMEEWFA